MALKDYLLTEKLNHEHAERYLTFVDRYHPDVWSDLHQRMCAAWESELSKIKEDTPPLEDLIQRRELRTPGISSELELLTSPHQLTSPRFRAPKAVSPIVKVPYVYHASTTDQILKRLLKSSHQVFNDTAKAWSEIFNYEKRGQVVPGFKIDGGDLPEGLKFKMTSAIGGEEAYRTIYSVQVDHGKAGSKTRDQDRIYLTSHV